jgi:CRP-like cAMP-binding protein
MTSLWTDEEIARFLQGGHLKTYPKGQILFSEGDRTNEVYFIEQGWVNVYRMTRDGDRVSIALRTSGEFIGISEMFRTDPRDCYAQALESIAIYSIGVDYINKLLDRHPDMQKKCLSQLSSRLHESHTTLLEFACNKAQKRMALTFLHIAEKSGTRKEARIPVSINLTQEEFASIIGSSRQMVNGLLKKFKESGCIEMTGRKIDAVYPERLRTYYAI